MPSKMWQNDTLWHMLNCGESSYLDDKQEQLENKSVETGSWRN